MLRFESKLPPETAQTEEPQPTFEQPDYVPTPEDHTRDLFNSAMMAVQANFVKKSGITDPYKERSTPEAELQRISTDECYQASIALLYHLEQSPQFQGNFHHAFLLTSKAEGTGTFTNDRWDNHVYAVTQGMEGTWYAASPANHESLETVEPDEHGGLPRTHMTMVLESSSLAGILDQIQQTDGGAWPDKDTVEAALTDPHFAEPHILPANEKSRYPKLGVTEISWDMSQGGLLTHFNHAGDLALARHELE